MAEAPDMENQATLSSAAQESTVEASRAPSEKSLAAPEAPTDTPSFQQRMRDFGFLPIPKHCRHHPDKPFNFTYAHAALFALASSFSKLLVGRSCKVDADRRMQRVRIKSLQRTWANAYVTLFYLPRHEFILLPAYFR
jgi:hypothetical protein